MGKGRIYAPSKIKEGVWFKHNGTGKTDLNREQATSTGRMMSAPFDSRNKNIPAPPPQPYDTKSEKNFKKSNRFSEHDNRNILQQDGNYFGNGKDTRHLGRHVTTESERQHFTDLDLLTHQPLHPENSRLQTEYRSTYLGDKTEFPPIHRRFPKVYSAPKEGRRKPDTNTTDWFEQKRPGFKTPLRVLAISQEPFLKHNPFKYSYHGNYHIYPSYTRKDGLLVKNVLNRYGAAYPKIS